MLLLLSLSHTPPRAVRRTLAAAPRAGCCGASRTLFSHVECGGMGERNGAFLALCLLLVREVASENLAIFAANVL